ncbi:MULTISPECIES: transposase, partial [Vagococcus]|uniref:transposase n=1 Tax=Vagococcus TaxID=2737 RepID=UPI000FF01093
MCKDCKSTFVLDTPFVSRNNSISNNLKRLVAKKLTSKQSMSDISKQANVSTSTVYRVLKEWYQPIQKYSYSLPAVLCFDEFKSVKKVAGSMSFIMIDGDTKELIDILPDRRLPKIEKYFNGFSLSSREQVKYVVSDIYQPYIILTKRLFPNAKVVLDKFHLVQHIGRA